MNTTVYYPHLYPSPEWLMLAALCWDKVYRMVWPDAPDDPREIQELDQLFGGILQPIDVATIGGNHELQERFARWLADQGDRIRFNSNTPRRADDSIGVYFFDAKFPQPLSESLRSAGFSTSSGETRLFVPDWEVSTRQEVRESGYYSEIRAVAGAAAPGSDQERYERLIEQSWDRRRAGDHVLSEALREQAEEIRRAHLTRFIDGESVVMVPREIAYHYLSLCALQAAEQGKRDLIADGEEFTGVVFNDVRAVRGEVATTVLQAYVPENLSRMDPHQIAEFREEFATQRLKYQKEIQSLVDDFAKVASEGELITLKEQMVEIAMERAEQVNGSYKRAKLDIATKAIGVSLTPPAVLATVASALGLGLFAPLGVAAALSLFGTTTLLALDRAKADKRINPWSYVLAASSL